MQKPTIQGRSILSRFAVPYTFNPDLNLGEAAAAVAGCLARIFGACVLFAIWGGVSVLAWSNIESHLWRALAVLGLVLLFLATLATLMAAISALEQKIFPKR